MSARILILLCLVMVASNVSSQQRLPAYPHAKLVSIESFEETDYRVVTGKVDVVNNIVRINSEKRMDVSGQQIVYNLVAGYSSRDAFEFFLQRITEKNGSILFQCTGRGCGDSNSWANVILNNSRLYGKEREQNYVVAEFNDGGRKSYALVYTIKRGNGKVYAYIEEFQNSALSQGDTNSILVKNTKILDKTFQSIESLQEFTSNIINDITMTPHLTNGKNVWLLLQAAIDSSGDISASIERTQKLLMPIEKQIERKHPHTTVSSVPLGGLLLDPAGKGYRLVVYID